MWLSRKGLLLAALGALLAAPELVAWLARAELPSGADTYSAIPRRAQERHPVATENRATELASRTLRSRRPRRVTSDLLAGEPTEQPGTQTEPYLHANPADPSHLVAGWQENRFSDGGAQALGVAVSFDGGRRWIESLLPTLTTATGGRWERASDPWVEFGAGSRVYYASLLWDPTTGDSAMGVSVSADGGLTWAAPVEVGLEHDPLLFNDKQALTVDTYPESRWYGRVYMAWHRAHYDSLSGEEREHTLVVTRSMKRGRGFRPLQPIQRRLANHSPVLRVGPGGTVYMSFTAHEPGGIRRILFTRSRNGGRTWSRPSFVADLRSVGVARHRVGAQQPSLAVDRASGDLYLVWPDSRWSPFVDHAALAISRDGGRTWSEPVSVSAGPPLVPTFTPAVAVNDRGAVAVSYFSFEHDPRGQHLVDLYLRISRDGGRTFSPPHRVTRGSFDARAAARANGFFLGDYTGLAGAGRFFHLLWIDTRRFSPTLGKTQPDVWTTRAR